MITYLAFSAVGLICLLFGFGIRPLVASLLGLEFLISVAAVFCERSAFEQFPILYVWLLLGPVLIWWLMKDAIESWLFWNASVAPLAGAALSAIVIATAATFAMKQIFSYVASISQAWIYGGFGAILLIVTVSVAAFAHRVEMEKTSRDLTEDA